MRILDLKMILACLRVLSENLNEQKEKALDNYNDQKIDEAKAAIIEYASSLPEEVLMRFRNKIGTDGSVLSVHYVSGDIIRCISILEDWIKETEEKA